MPLAPGRAWRTVVLAVVLAVSCSSCTTAPDALTPTATAPVEFTEHGPIVLATRGDATGTWANIVDQWNQAHPSEPVTIRELPADADQQHAAMAARGDAKSGEFTVMALDIAWTAEFASKGWLTELPAESFPTTGLLAASVAQASYDGRLYGYPATADAALLYYRKDLLDRYDVKVPQTWAELKTACSRILPTQSGMSCYGGQLGQYEALTCNVSEAMTAAGGGLFTAAGKPSVNTAGSIRGLQWLAAAVKDGTIPTEALAWDEDDTSRAFANGKLLFQRNWSDAWGQAERGDGSSRVVGRVGVTRLVGESSSAQSTLGGRSLAISAFGTNTGTAADFVRWVASAQVQRELLQDGSSAPVLESLYDDAALAKRVPYLSTLAESVRTAKARPALVGYIQVSQSIQQATHPVLAGARDAAGAMADLQTALETQLK